ncbi:MAG: hypothetical protein R3B54_05560 [Bdellovibrionota bacterium]
MARKLILTALFLAQGTLYAVPLGVQLGLSFSRSNRPGDTATGLLGGLTTDLSLASGIGFAPEANLFVPSGNVTYVSLPLLFRGSLDLSPDFALQLLLGPDIGFRLTGATFRATNLWLATGLALYTRISESLGIRLSLRHGLGLTDFTAAGGDDRLHYVQLVLGAYFQI